MRDDGESHEALNWTELAERIGWDEIRRRFNEIATEQGDYAGVPVPVGNMRPVMANDRQRAAEIWPLEVPGRQLPLNRWHVRKAFSVYLLRDDGRTVGTVLNYWAARLDAMFDTLYALRAVLPEAEMVAFAKLLEHLSDSQARDYVVGNAFSERGRSGLIYVFRRGLPVLTFRTEEGSVEPRAALCLHPLAYYEGTHAGAMPPSDELLALLLMLRADEPYLWRKANQLDIRDPMVAI